VCVCVHMHACMHACVCECVTISVLCVCVCMGVYVCQDVRMYSSKSESTAEVSTCMCVHCFKACEQGG